jgi:hypothetical protein
MRRCLSAVTALLAALLILSNSTHGADAPYVGTWKVIVEPTGQEITLFILAIEEKGSEPKIDLVAGLPLFRKSKITVEKGDGALRFTTTGAVDLKCVFYPPRGEKQPKKILGSIQLGEIVDFARLERTEDRTFQAETAARMHPDAKSFFKASHRGTEPKEKEAALKELLGKYAGTPMGCRCNLALLDALGANGAREADLGAMAKKAIDFAADFGPEMKRFILTDAAHRLVRWRKAPSLALEYNRIAVKALPADATPLQQVNLLKPLALALKQNDKTEELQPITERIAHLEKVLDEEFLKTAVPFETTPFTRSNGKSRVALVELFTGAQCPPCVAADIAFDAGLKTWKPSDVILLQYHVHIPGPDALTNEDSEARYIYYPAEGTPSTRINGGKALERFGGPKEDGKKLFDQLSVAVREALDSDATVKLDLTARRRGQDIVINARVADLKEPGEEMKLRLVLIEDVVRYPGRNQQRFHHHVVRAMPGGPGGFELKEAQHEQEVRINLVNLRKKLSDYLEKFDRNLPFLTEERPLELKNLKVVAFIQNDKTKEVLQAVQADLQVVKGR